MSKKIFLGASSDRLIDFDDKFTEVYDSARDLHIAPKSLEHVCDLYIAMTDVFNLQLVMGEDFVAEGFSALLLNSRNEVVEEYTPLDLIDSLSVFGDTTYELQVILDNPETDNYTLEIQSYGIADKTIRIAYNSSN